MKLVLDTSVVVAGVRSPNGASRRWLESVLLGHNTLLVSVPLVLEYEAVLKRPENLTAAKLLSDDIDVLIDGLCSVGKPVKLDFLWRPTLPDPDDELVLETAFLGNADLLLTFNIRDFTPASTLGVRVERPGPAWVQFLQDR